MLNYAIVDVNIQIHKIISYPLYLILMTVFSSIIMINTKNLIVILLKFQ